MRMKELMCLLLIAAVAGLGGQAAWAQNKEKHVPLQKTIGVPSDAAPTPTLVVVNADGATLADGKLTLTGVQKSSIIFADRPVRAAGHVLVSEFIKSWGDGKDSFVKDPPNATVSVLGGSGDDIKDAVVVLSSPKLDGDNLVFDVSVLEGDLDKATGPASLFIDWWGHRWGARGAFYAGVAAGAAATAYPPPYYPPPYYPPPYYGHRCGYYPYPPCY